MLTPEERRGLVLQILTKGQGASHPSFTLAKMCDIIFYNRLTAMESVIGSAPDELIEFNKKGAFVFIKPAGDMCNLRCKYCYITNDKRRAGLMNYETLERVVQQATDAFSEFSFVFHGGEPLMAGIEFFKKALEIQNKYKKKNQLIRNIVQTNGTLLDDTWANFFNENYFRVGISIDGPSHVHDLNRIDKSGNGSFSRVMKGIKCLHSYQLRYNLLNVVTCPPVISPGELFDFFEGLGVTEWRSNPCRRKDSESCYPDYICELFDIWLASGKKTIIHPIFEIISANLGYSPFLCQMAGTCQRFVGVDYDGGVSPCCEMPVAPEFYLGNVNDTPLMELLEKPKALMFWDEKYKGDELCSGCKWWYMCHGGCTYHRLMSHGTPFAKDFLCGLYMDLFEKLIGRIDHILTEGAKTL